MTDQSPPEHHAVLVRILTKRGRFGLPIEVPEVNVCQERHLGWFLRQGWSVLIRESDLPNSSQFNPPHLQP